MTPQHQLSLRILDRLEALRFAEEDVADVVDAILPIVRSDLAALERSVEEDVRRDERLYRTDWCAAHDRWFSTCLRSDWENDPNGWAACRKERVTYDEGRRRMGQAVPA